MEKYAITFAIISFRKSAFFKIRFVLYLLSMFFLRICIYCAFYRLFQYSYCIFSTASV